MIIEKRKQFRHVCATVSFFIEENLMERGKIFVRKKAKLWKITAMFLLFGVLSGCAGTGKSDKEQNTEDAVIDYTCISKAESDRKIYVILKNYHGDYWKKVIEGITSAAEKTDAAVYLGGIDNETDVAGQIKLVDEAIENEADGVLLAPANSNSLESSCEKIRENKIPLALIDSSVNSGEFDACYMTDNMDAGKKAAKEMLEMLYEAGNAPEDSLEVGILLSSDTSQAMVNRVSGFLDYWTNYAPDQWKIAKDILINGGNVQKAQDDAAALLDKNSRIRGIYGCNNTSTTGIVKTLLSEKRTDIVMVGFDLAEETKKFIQDPNYYGVTLVQKQEQMGYLGMLALDSLMNGKELEQKYYDTGVIVVDADYLMENEIS